MTPAAGFAGGSTPSQVIGRYLSQLAAAASGLDAALVNDMLADAEQHLWNAVSEGVPAEQAVADFGDPKDVVAGYLSTDRSRKQPPAATQAAIAVPPAQADEPPPAAPRRGLLALPVLGVWFDRYAWGALALFLIGLLLGTVYFKIVLTWLVLSLGTMILIIGFPLLVGLLGFCRIVGLGHGRMIEFLTGVRMPRRTAPVAGGASVTFWGRIKLWLSDGRSWLSVAFLLGNMPVSLLLFFVFFALTSISVAMTFAPLSACLIPEAWGHSGTHFVFGSWSGDHLPLPLALLSAALGLALFTGTLWLAKGCGWLYAQVVKAIQVSRPVPGVPVQTA